MALKMVDGYICDKCDSPLIPMDDITENIMEIFRKFIVRIYCPRCGEIVETAETTMRLKDVGDIHEI